MSHIQNRSRLFAAIFCLCLCSLAAFAQTPTPPPDAPTENFVARLLDAPNDEARRTLLDSLPVDVNPIAVRQSLVARGDAARTKSDFDAALKIFLAAQAVAEKFKDETGIAEALNKQGAVYRMKGEYDRALPLHEASLKRFTAAANRAGMGAALNNIALIHYFRGDYTRAMDFLRRALTEREAAGDEAIANQTRNNIAAVLEVQGRIDEALETHKQLLASARRLNDTDGISTALNNIGNIYSEQGDYRQAMENLLEALKYHEQLGDKYYIALTLNNIGQIYFLQGNLESAVLYYERSRKLREETNDQKGLAVTLMHLGLVRSANDEYAQALELLQKSLALREKIGDKRGIAITLNNLGRIQFRHNETEAALASFQKSLAQYETIEYKDGAAQTLTNIARASLALGKTADALDTATRAVQIARETGARETLWNALSLLGQAQRASGKPSDAQATFREAVSIIETVRQKTSGGDYDRQKFFEDKIAPYHQLIELLVADKKPEEALRFAEQAKGRVLLDILQSGQAALDKSLTEAERAEEKRLKSNLYVLENETRKALQEKTERAALADLQTRLDRARSGLDQFTNRLYAAHPELKLQRGETQIADLSALNKLLPDAGNAALLEYVVTENRSFVFVLTKDKTKPILQVFPIEIGREDLTKKIAAFREKLAKRDIRFGDDAKKIYNLLLAPVAKQIAGKNRLIISPDAALWELPFQALVDNQNKYVIETAAVSYAPSLSVLTEIVNRRGAQPTESTLLAFGNPAFKTANSIDEKTARPVLMNNAFADLPEAEKQVEALSALYGAKHSKIFTGSKATETEFKKSAAGFSILHLATHGVLDNANPLYSYVLLASDAGKEDGRLEAREVMQMNLNANLVVLSACETARGSIGQGEGLIGLSWSFFVAGSPTTVASQWKVESASTTETMLGFYRRIQKDSKSISKAEALRQASLALLKNEKYAHPFYWAGFVLLGDDK